MHLARILRFLGYFLVTVLVMGGCALTPHQASSPVSNRSQAPVIIDPAPLAKQELVPLATLGPWPAITHLIGYNDRLWFANSVTGVNHNSADLYSYDPMTHQTRYEHHLFSQGVGQPMVAAGLLYWPFEDPRFSIDRGEYMVTNGEQWQWRTLPTGEAFHTHTLAAHSGTLLAGTGAWAGRLHRSQDNGQSWQVVYEHPTPAGQVSRLTELAFLGDQLYVGMTALQSKEVQLLTGEASQLTPVRHWPAGKAVTQLTAYNGWLYGINTNLDDGVTLWRTDGQAAEPITALMPYGVQAIATSDHALWVISSDAAGHFLWHSDNGMDWTAAYQFKGLIPLDIEVYQNQVYVGARDEKNRGVLLGPQTLQPETTRPSSKRVTLPSNPQTQDPHALQQALQQLDSLLSSAATYRGEETPGLLLNALMPLALSQTKVVGEILSEQLTRSFPDVEVTLFADLTASATEIARWYLLWAIGLNGQGHVPIELLTEPWHKPSNNPEKYWQTVPAATWAIAQVGQADRETLAALMQRLTQPDDPLWVTGDVIGALNTLTQQTFGYDIPAWQTWWQGGNEQRGEGKGGRGKG